MDPEICGSISAPTQGMHKLFAGDARVVLIDMKGCLLNQYVVWLTCSYLFSKSLGSNTCLWWPKHRCLGHVRCRVRAPTYAGLRRETKKVCGAVSYVQ